MGNKITSPNELRAVLLSTMEGIIEGKVSVSQGNAIASISQEVHKSIRQEWDMRCFAAENLSIADGKIVNVLLEGDACTS